MSSAMCAVCGGPLVEGFVVTTNGSGLFWAHRSAPMRLRPKGLEVIVGTGFGGTYSANLPGRRCAQCRTILIALPPEKTP